MIPWDDFRRKDRALSAAVLGFVIGILSGWAIFVVSIIITMNNVHADGIIILAGFAVVCFSVLGAGLGYFIGYRVAP